MNNERHLSDSASLKKSLFTTTDESSLNDGFFSGKLDVGKTQLTIPKLSLPKGGGAIRGIDQKFEVNPSNGTATLSIPIPVSPGRNGFQPGITLNYNSGAGNSVFGVGWNIGLTNFQRRTDKALPLCEDELESDVFVYSDSEDLQPFLVNDEKGEWNTDLRQCDGLTIKRYRPRVEKSFSRIEQITHPEKGIYWKYTDKENVVTYYGYDQNSRIADPGNDQKVFRWLPYLSYNDKGDWMQYFYAEENLAGVLQSLPEKNRLTGKAKITNRYLKKICYGNRLPFYPDPQHPYTPDKPADDTHFFELVFDYGDEGGDYGNKEGSTWPCRIDPFSDFHACFEIRTYRLCHRILMVHLFPELGEGPTLIQSLDLQYHTPSGGDDAQPVELSFLRSITQRGHLRQDEKEADKYLSKSLPPLEFGYQPLQWDTAIRTVSPDNIANAPAGLTDYYQWTDLYGEGISGILSEQADAWYYKQNLGNGNFSAATLVAPKPSFTGLAGGTLQLLDLDANGSRQLVSLERGSQGYFALLDNNQWETYRQFEQVTVIDPADPYMRLIDLDGDGRPDILVTEERVFRWYPSLGTRGYAPSKAVTPDPDEETSPRVIFADPEQSIFLADMSGDGLTDIVRIRNGSVCYWPNMGYGRFGPKVEMSNAPWFDFPDQFNPGYIYLADISGTGTTDILYLGRRTFHAWLNFNGNSWSSPCVIDPFPGTADPNRVAVLDLLGNGTACIVWSSPLPANSQTPLRYIDLMGGRKPHVMHFYSNHCGLETRLTYKSSTQYYVRDKKEGKPWITKLPFPVQCVSKKEILDTTTNTYYSTEYSYHHGYYDHPEREFRGFGRVDKTDTQLFEVSPTANYDNYQEPDLDQPPVLTRTWFHVGAYLRDKQILDHYRHEYWYNQEAFLNHFGPGHNPEHFLPDARIDGRLDNQEKREALRACKGMVLRTEVFALDGSERQLLPYTVSEHNCYIRKLQPVAHNRYAVFMLAESESIVYSYERSIHDPRIAHTFNLQLDDLGNILRSASVVYPRKMRPADLTDDGVWKEQHTTHILLMESSYTGDILSPQVYRLRLPYEVKNFACTGILLSPGKFYYSIEDFDRPLEEIPFEQRPPDDSPVRRLFDYSKRIYLDNDLVHPLPGGKIDSLGLLYESYQLVTTDGLLRENYVRDGRPLVGDIAATMTEAEYVDPEQDGHWWSRSGRKIFEERSKAKEMFYQPRAFEDAFGARTTVRYYKEDHPHPHRYWLFVDEVIDALGNSIKMMRCNFRNFSPELLRDINHNLVQAVYDELGMLVATATQGKEGEQVGDLIDDTVRVSLSAEEIHSFFENPFSIDGDPRGDTQGDTQDDHRSDPLEKGRRLLGHATTRVLYDFDAVPVRSATILRETHFLALGPGEESKLQYTFEYSNGAGNALLKKVQAPAGPAWGRSHDDGHWGWNEHVTHRWIGNGRTVLNNKGKPVKQYEPYFSNTHHCEPEDLLVRHGVSPTLHYDPLGRVIRTDMPDGTFAKTIFDNWRHLLFDANDTVLESSWYRERIDGVVDDQGKDPEREKQTAEKAAVHAHTFSTIHLDSLGRASAMVHINKWQATRLLDPGEEVHITRIDMDIKGNVIRVTDPRHNTVMTYRYDMADQVIFQHSMDTHERWVLNDCQGKPIFAWDSRGQEFVTRYDLLQRPVEVSVSSRYFGPRQSREPQETDPTEGPAKKRTFSKVFYGNSDPASIAANLNGHAVKVYDTAGRSTIREVDFKGNILSTSRELCADYRETVDWSGATESDPGLALDPHAFFTRTSFDGLNRPLLIHSPHRELEKANRLFPVYNETNQLDGLTAILRDGDHKTPMIKKITYDEKGQRARIIYGNDTASTYTYDKKSFRLLHLRTRAKAAASGELLQSLSYTYDPTGNICHIRDDAFQRIFFKSKVVEPSNDFIYDALYRLIQAKGREFGPQDSPVSAFDFIRMVREEIPFHNSQELQRYTQCYAYDRAGNMLEMLHAPTLGNGWKRKFHYQSLNNQLRSTQLAGPDHWAHYDYDNHGNLLGLEHFQDMYWNFDDKLVHARQSAGDPATSGQESWYVYGADGKRIRKVVKKNDRFEETIYIGLVEFYQEFREHHEDNQEHHQEPHQHHDNKEIIAEKETLHIMDDRRRIALVETVIQAPPGTENTDNLIRYQLGNHLDTVSLELDQSGRIVSYEEYYPFGNTSFQLNNKSVRASSKRYRFMGMERDEESGLNYQGARYYIPWLARWSACDPMGVKGGSLNAYKAFKNSPIRFVDPSGNQDIEPNFTPAGGGLHQSQALALNVDEALAVGERGISAAESMRRAMDMSNRQFLDSFFNQATKGERALFTSPRPPMSYAPTTVAENPSALITRSSLGGIAEWDQMSQFIMNKVGPRLAGKTAGQVKEIINDAIREELKFPTTAAGRTISESLSNQMRMPAEDLFGPKFRVTSTWSGTTKVFGEPSESLMPTPDPIADPIPDPVPDAPPVIDPLPEPGVIIPEPSIGEIGFGLVKGVVINYVTTVISVNIVEGSKFNQEQRVLDWANHKDVAASDEKRVHDEGVMYGLGPVPGLNIYAAVATRIILDGAYDAINQDRERQVETFQRNNPDAPPEAFDQLQKAEEDFNNGLWP